MDEVIMPSKDFYRKWRAAGMCGWCNTPAAQFKDGTYKSLCAPHAEKANKNHKIWQKEMGNPSARKHYWKFKKEGKCTVCGEKKDRMDRVRCGKCRAKINTYYKGKRK
jgi:hypothetical protein